MYVTFFFFFLVYDLVDDESHWWVPLGKNLTRIKSFHTNLLICTTQR